MLRLRWQYFRSEEFQTSFHARTLMITRVPPRQQSDGALAQVLADIKMPYPTTEVHIGRETGKLPELIDRHRDFVRKLEAVLASYLKDPKGVSGHRPTHRVGSTFGMGGKKVDSIDYYTAQINRTESEIEAWRERIAEKKPQSYGFASLAAAHYAHAAGKSLKKKKVKKLKIDLAPVPNAILWQNLTKSRLSKAKSSFLGFLLLVVLLFINAVPLLAVSLISSMGLFTATVPFLNSWHNASSWSFAAVAGLLPPLISGVAGYLLPLLMRRIARYRGLNTKTKLDKVILSQYFAFLVISQFLVFTLLGTVINLIGTIITNVQHRESATQILAGIGTNLPRSIKSQYFILGNYWLTWMPFRGYMAIFDLAQAIKLLLVWVRKGLFGRTPRDVREFTQPPWFDYSVYYANLLFMGAVCMLYACLNPLVVILGAVAFWMASFVSKYMLMFVNATKYETGGGHWRLVINRLLVSIVFMQVILVLAVLLDNLSTWWRVIACLPPILFVIGFKIYCKRVFEDQYKWYIPKGEEAANNIVHKGDASHHRLQRRFGHPALHEKLWTPMVHAKVQHLLPQVYRGRIEGHGTAIVDGRKMQTEKLEGGLKIALVQEDQLEYDPKKDSDSRSIMSATTVATGMGRPISPASNLAGTGAYGGSTSSFNKQYANYLAGTPAGGGDYELGDFGRASRDNLLQQNEGRRYSESLDGTLVSAHGRRPSAGDMYKNIGGFSGPTTPAYGGPPAAGYFYPDASPGSQTPMRQMSNGAMQPQYNGAPPPAAMQHPARQPSSYSGFSDNNSGFVSANSSPVAAPARVGGAGGSAPPPQLQAGMMYNNQGPPRYNAGGPGAFPPSSLAGPPINGNYQPAYSHPAPPPHMMQQQHRPSGPVAPPPQFAPQYAAHPPQGPHGGSPQQPRRQQSPGPHQMMDPGNAAESFYR